MNLENKTLYELCELRDRIMDKIQDIKNKESVITYRLKIDMKLTKYYLSLENALNCISANNKEIKRINDTNIASERSKHHGIDVVSITMLVKDRLMVKRDIELGLYEDCDCYRYESQE